MPVRCPIGLPRISDDEMRSIDYAVMSHAFATHNELGQLADEAVYQEKLAQLLGPAGIEAKTEVPIELSFRQFSTELAMDMVVERKIIYELKTTAALTTAHDSQLLSYLFLNNATHGKLINFRSSSVQTKFINSNLTTKERQQFEMVLADYCGESSLVDLILKLIFDWGTGLNAALYRRAILACGSDQTDPEQMLAMMSAGLPIGKQRFCLLNTDTAIGVTTFKKLEKEHFTSFQKLAAASPLKQIQWLNITHRRVTLSTISSS